MNFDKSADNKSGKKSDKQCNATTTQNSFP